MPDNMHDMHHGVADTRACPYCAAHDYFFVDEHHKVFLAHDQTLPGRLVVATQRHVSDLGSLTADEWLSFGGVVRRCERGLRESFGATMFNWTSMMNNAYLVQHASAHVHWHARPRYPAPVTFAGLTFVDKNFGRHYAQGTDLRLSDDVRRQMVTEILKYL